MKTKEELIKIYSAYLPYELELNIENEIETEYTMFLGEMDSIMPGNVILLGITKETSYMPECILYTRNDGEADGYIQIKNAKPVLYSMDMLTKEIEHKWERLVPLRKILEEYSFDLSKMNDEEILSYSESLIDIDMTVTTQNLLLEWHFNIFGLDESEYIKKQSVIQK